MMATAVAVVAVND
jgi:hypothetical protein